MNDETRKAWLITNHAPMNIPSGYENIKGDIIAVDRGLIRVRDLNLTPRVIIGDMDSLPAEELRRYPDTEIIRHQAEKNETDTELALIWCVQTGVYDEIIVCNSLDGRFDHSAGIIQNLIWLHLQKIPARIESQDQTLFFLKSDTLIKGKPGDMLSLISYSEYSRFVDSIGLKYPLDKLILAQHQSRGISNELIHKSALIRLEEGLVLAVFTRV
ncbi:MAG: thiamine diphosphokinase [Candidatus Cloacimonetes bacterium]|jgi:thiamine pyrophosphokinase|nr:thiamine diphosphokinase [Candidatus Cloacimonadota bacterium]NLO43662.1 thiamine diphosphokinase [Candidatus Cloacimonadota bacterium]